MYRSNAFDSIAIIFCGYIIILVHCDVGVADNFVKWNKNGDRNDDPISNLAYVKLLTTPRHKRDLSVDDYHILEIKIPASNKTITLHLSKENASISPDLKTVVHDVVSGIGKPVEQYGVDESHDCLYTGVISGNVQGNAALSSCDKNLPGFSGIIVENHKRFFLQPLKLDNTGNKNVRITVSHIVHTIEEVGCTISASKIENGIDIPKYIHKKSALKVKRETNEINDEITFGDQLEESNNDNYLADNLMPFANAKQSNPTSKGKSKDKNNKSKKGDRAVDLAIYIDAALYRHFHKLFPKDTANKLKAYVLTIVNAINMKYHDPSLGMKLEIRLVHLEIMKTNPPDLQVAVEGAEYLEHFRRFAVKKNPKVDLWDHACLLTGVDIRLQGGGLLGMAYDGSVCLPEFYTSIVRADTFEAVYVGTHEIGHNLGIDHDGEVGNEDCAGTSNLMSPSTGGGKVTWSPCSGKNLKHFITTGETHDKQKFLPNGPTCLDSKTKKSKSIKYTSKLLPGEKYTAKDQCIYALGEGALPNTEGQNSNMCYNLACTYIYPEDGMTYLRTIHPALEGTKCDSNKYCRTGVCTQKKKN